MMLLLCNAVVLIIAGVALYLAVVVVGDWLARMLGFGGLLDPEELPL